MAGKPYPLIYEVCLARAGKLLGRPTDKARVLAIGDGVITDLAGAAQQGLDALFIAGGIHGADTRGPDGRLDPAAVERLLVTEDAKAAYLMDALAA